MPKIPRLDNVNVRVYEQPAKGIHGIPQGNYVHPVARVSGIGNDFPKGFELPGCILDQCCDEPEPPVGMLINSFMWTNVTDPGGFGPGQWRLDLAILNQTAFTMRFLALTPGLPMQTGFGVEMPAWIPGDDFDIPGGVSIPAGQVYTLTKFVDVVVPIGVADHTFTYTIPVGSITGTVDGAPIANTQAVSATMRIYIVP